MDFTGQVALVTGGSRGIGAATVRQLAARGAKVLFCYRERADAAAEVEASCGAFSGEVYGRQADLRNKSEASALLDEALARWGRLDVLVNNAAILDNAAIEQMTLQQWHAVLHADLTSVYYTCKAAVKPMMKARYGRIVNVAGLQGKAGGVEQANYAAAAGGTLGLTRALARELAPWNITVNAVAPGLIDTDQLAEQPAALRRLGLDIAALRRVGTADEVAHAIVFLAARESSFITGQSLAVDGGWTMT